MASTKHPLVLTILDGWGYRAETANNAIALARKPAYDKLLREFPNTLIQASEHFVGLPDGQMGNSEVGHLNIGAGPHCADGHHAHRHALIASGEFQKDPAIVQAMQHAREGGRQLHLFGLVSDGGVHSHQEHLYALLRMAREYGLERVFVHAFMDGRDTAPDSGAGYIAKLEQKMREYGVGKVASDQRPLLRDGSRQALGTRAQGVRRDGERQGRGRRLSRSGRAHQGKLQQRRHG